MSPGTARLIELALPAEEARHRSWRVAFGPKRSTPPPYGSIASGGQPLPFPERLGSRLAEHPCALQGLPRSSPSWSPYGRKVSVRISRAAQSEKGMRCVHGGSLQQWYPWWVSSAWPRASGPRWPWTRPTSISSPLAVGLTTALAWPCSWRLCASWAPSWRIRFRDTGGGERRSSRTGRVGPDAVGRPT